MLLFVNVKVYVLVTTDIVPNNRMNIISITLFFKLLHFYYKFDTYLYENWRF
jgi:hypothetical protein